MSRITMGLAAGILAGAIGMTGTSLAAGAASTSGHHAPVCVVNGVPNPATQHVIPKRMSLAKWSAEHGTYPENVLSATAQCAGGWQQLSFAKYVGKGGWTRCGPWTAIISWKYRTIVWAFPYRN